MTIARSHDMSVFLVCLWGIAALFLTGEFSIGVVGIAWALQVIAFWSQRRGLRVEAAHINILTLTVFLGVFILAQRSLLDAAIYFFIYLQIAKLLTLKSSRDAFWIYVTAFFQVVGAAVLTTSIGFTVIFLVYVTLMVYSLILQNARKGIEHSAQRAVRVGGAPALASATAAAAPSWTTFDRFQRRLTLAGSAATLAICVLVVSVGFFFLIPRLSSQTIIPHTSSGEDMASISAFDEFVEFGAFGAISLDSSVALYVHPLRGARPQSVRLRGVALDTFDGRRWSRTTIPDMRGSPFQQFMRNNKYPSQEFRIIQPGNITKYLFAPVFPEQLKLKQDILVIHDSVSNAAWLTQSLPRDIHYDVQCRVEELSAREDPENFLRRDAENDAAAAQELLSGIEGVASSIRDTAARYSTDLARAQRRFVETGPESRSRGRQDSGSFWPGSARIREVPGNQARDNFRERIRPEPPYMRRLLAVPSTVNRQRLRALAEEWTAGTRTAFQRALALERTFHEEFEYTLERRVTGNHVEDFLFTVRAGHCEYFATAMVMLLRSMDIPCRIVNGYYSTEWNDRGGAFIVRQSTAHSWVEVFFDGYGWMTFDPTPPAGVGGPPPMAPWLVAYTRLADSLKLTWYRYIIDYDIEEQSGVMRAIWRLPRLMRELTNRLQAFGSGSFEMRGHSYTGLVTAGLLAAGLGLIATFMFLRHRAHSARKGRSGLVMAVSARLVAFYMEILRLLGRRGHARTAGETPAEFAGRVASTEGRLESFPRVTAWYYRQRYKGDKPADGERAEIEKFIKNLKAK